VLARNEDRDDVLYRRVDPSRIGVTGLSMGALTSMLATYHRDLMDPRIAAAVFIAGPTTLFTETFFTSASVPSMLVYADADSLVQHGEHAQPALQKIDGGILVTLRNASHAGFAQPASTIMRFMKNPDSIACRMVRAGLGDAAMADVPYEELLGGVRAGIADPGPFLVRSYPVVERAMKAARQQMFTKLAVHAFLESRFARREPERAAARQFLLHELPAENPAEVSVVEAASGRARGAPRRKPTRRRRAA